jgi:ribonuclease BN (tRNA processing enzyme)
MKVTVLGTSSPYPRPGDPCSSLLLDTGEARVWVDTGAGTLAALLMYCSLEDLDAVWVSHTHADHFSDLAVTYYALLYAGISRPPLPVFGPPGWAERLRAFLAHSAGASPIERAFSVHELADGQTVVLGGAVLVAVEVRHDARCFGLRASSHGQLVAYTGDTGPGPGLARVAAGADLLVSEAGYGLMAGEDEPVHLTAAQAGATAAAAGSKQLLLTHLGGADVTACVEAARLAGAAGVVAARAGMTIDLGS